MTRLGSAFVALGLLASCGGSAPPARAPARNLPPPLALQGQSPWQVDSKDGYAVGLDEAAAWNDRATWHLTRRGARAGAPAWMKSTVPVHPYEGKRVQLDLEVRTQGEPGMYALEAATFTGGFRDATQIVKVDPIPEFRHAALVLDVPTGAETIGIGVGAESPAEIWVGATRITEVPAGTALTTKPAIELDGWRLMGSGRSQFEAAVDPGVMRDGKPTLHVRALERPFPGTDAGIFRVVPSAQYLGQRLRLSFWVKTSNAGRTICEAREEAGMGWTNSAVSSAPKKLPATSDWQECTTEVLVRKGTGQILYGAVLWSTGDVWVDAPTLAALGNEAQQ